MNFIKPLLLLFIGGVVSANTLLMNGTVYTVNLKHPWAQAVLIDQDRIVYVGDTKHALILANKDTNIVDLNGSFVMPGIIDAHTHIAMGSVLLSEGVNLMEVKGKQAILEHIQSYALSHQEVSVISGFGFYPFAMGVHGPTAAQLDAIIPDKPVFLISNNGHSAWVNSKTLKMLGITKATPDPQKGMHYYARDHEGNPTGFLVEGSAFWPHLSTMGIGAKDSFYRSLKTYLPKLSQQGITALFDAGAPAVEVASFEAIKQLETEDALPLRYFGSHFILCTKDADNAANTLAQYQKKYNTKLLNISGVKFSNDNSDDDNFAMQFDLLQLKHFFGKLMKNNVDVMVHASNDQSVHRAIDAIQEARKSLTKTQSRFTLAHVNMVRDSDFKRFKKLHIIANIQPFNAQGEGYYDYRYMLYGKVWDNKLARYNTFFKQHVVVSSSSDFPACNNDLQQCSPFHGMEIGITRQKIGSPLNAPILPDAKERLSMEQMIRAYTMNAAYQLHQEKEIGSLEAGKKADLIVLNKNPFETEAKEIHHLKVQTTMMNGKVVFDRSRLQIR